MGFGFQQPFSLGIVFAFSHWHLSITQRSASGRILLGDGVSKILSPDKPSASAHSLSELLQIIERWYRQHGIEEKHTLSGVWYRGLGTVKPQALQPGVYRDAFIERARMASHRRGPNSSNTDTEDLVLALEREMLKEFRATGARSFDTENVTEVYFIAQHFGMPTRLLDWTTNPLAALFFVVQDVASHDCDGELFLMEASRVLPQGYERHVWGMHDALVQDAIGCSFWQTPTTPDVEKNPLIIPVRPDNLPGRIGQQSSCFTLHMHKSCDADNDTLIRISIPAAAKETLLKELRWLNINDFTIFNDLDNLSKYIRKAWDLA